MTTKHDTRVSSEINPAGSATDIALVTQVVLAERQGRDRGWWDQMAASFWPDASVRLSWYDGDGAGFVAGSRAMTERGAVALHQVFAPVVQVRGTRAFVEMPIAMRLQVKIEEVGGDLVSHTRLIYRLEQRQGEWRIVSLDAIYEYTTLTPSIPGQVITIHPDELAGYRPSYAILAWHIAREGRSPSQNELGDDRPDEVAALYEGVRSWLAASTPNEASNGRPPVVGESGGAV